MAVSPFSGSPSIGSPNGNGTVDVALAVGLLLSLLGALFLVGTIYLSVAVGVALAVHVFGLVPQTDFEGFDAWVVVAFFVGIGLLIVL